MSKRYSIAEARSNLPGIVDEVAMGQEIELTRRGKSVAVLMSLRQRDRLQLGRSHFSEAYRRFLTAYPLRDLGVDDDLVKATRDRGPGRKVAL